MAMECVVVQDIFLNETAKYAHVFLPGSSFLEKDGTFTNAERRISRVRKVMPPQAGLGRLGSDGASCRTRSATRWTTRIPSEIMARDRGADADLRAASATRRSTSLGSVQWPCNDATRRGGTPTMHVDNFVRGKGRFIITQYVATDEKVTRKFPLLLTTGPHPVAVQRRRADAAHAQQPVAQRGPAGDPSARRARSAASRTTTGSASRAAPARPCCARRSPSACSRAWSTPPSTSPSRAPT